MDHSTLQHRGPGVLIGTTGGATNVCYWPILLQKSQNAGDHFSHQTAEQVANANRYSLTPVPEVTGKFITDDMTHHMFISTSRLQPGNFMINDEKRLLQQYRPNAAAPVVCFGVRYVRYYCRAGSASAKQFMT
jgi:hypothetical protein